MEDRVYDWLFPRISAPTVRLSVKQCSIVTGTPQSLPDLQIGNNSKKQIKGTGSAGRDGMQFAIIYSIS